MKCDTEVTKVTEALSLGWLRWWEKRENFTKKNGNSTEYLSCCLSDLKFLKQIEGLLHSINIYPEPVVSPSGGVGKMKGKDGGFPVPGNLVSPPQGAPDKWPHPRLSFCLTAQADNTHLFCPNLLLVATYLLELQAQRLPNILESQHPEYLSNFFNGDLEQKKHQRVSFIR